MTDYRWFESPESIGSRFVGDADELVKLGHIGWYLNDFQDETAWGVVWQLPARKGRPVYLTGIRTSYDDCKECGREEGAAFELPLQTNPGLEEAAREADECARDLAEREREYQRKSDAAVHWLDTFEEEKEARCAVKHARKVLKREKAELDMIRRKREELESIWGEDSLREMEV